MSFLNHASVYAYVLVVGSSARTLPNTFGLDTKRSPTWCGTVTMVTRRTARSLVHSLPWSTVVRFTVSLAAYDLTVYRGTTLALAIIPAGYLAVVPSQVVCSTTWSSTSSPHGLGFPITMGRGCTRNFG